MHHFQFENPEGQNARWSSKLQEDDFEVEHKTDRGNGNVDSLSRRPCDHDCKYCLKVGQNYGIDNQIVRRLDLKSDTAWNLSKELLEDDDLGSIF